MLKIKSVRTVGFVGDGDRIVKELTSPLKKAANPIVFIISPHFTGWKMLMMRQSELLCFLLSICFAI